MKDRTQIKFELINSRDILIKYIIHWLSEMQISLDILHFYWLTLVAPVGGAPFTGLQGALSASAGLLWELV